MEPTASNSTAQLLHLTNMHISELQLRVACLEQELITGAQYITDARAVLAENATRVANDAAKAADEDVATATVAGDEREAKRKQKIVLRSLGSLTGFKDAPVDPDRHARQLPGLRKCDGMMFTIRRAFSSAIGTTITEALNHPANNAADIDPDTGEGWSRDPIAEPYTNEEIGASPTTHQLHLD